MSWNKSQFLFSISTAGFEIFLPGEYNFVFAVTIFVWPPFGLLPGCWTFHEMGCVGSKSDVSEKYIELWGPVVMQLMLSKSRKIHSVGHQWRWDMGMDLIYHCYSTYCVVYNPDNKVHGANMGPTWVLSAPDGPHEPCYQGISCYIGLHYDATWLFLWEYNTVIVLNNMAKYRMPWSFHLSIYLSSVLIYTNRECVRVSDHQCMIFWSKISIHKQKWSYILF